MTVCQNEKVKEDDLIVREYEIYKAFNYEDEEILSQLMEKYTKEKIKKSIQKYLRREFI